ncbi:MAG: beta-galactosidase [Lentisphaeria bacterium]|nr:beta-galactosidase [Lentisphaeria bacterium]
MIKRILCSTAVIAGFMLSAGEAWSSSNPARYSKTNFKNAIWHESFEGDEVPYDVQFHGGAKGKIEIINSNARTGKKALRTIKSNNKGFIVIKFKKTIEVKEGEKLQFNSFYQGKKNFPLYSKAMLRIQTPGQKNFKVFSLYPGINGGDRMQEIITTPKDTWERKFTQRKVEKGMTVFEPTLVLAGAASVAVWDDFYIEDDNISAENWNNNLNRRPPLDRSKEMISNEELDKILEKSIDHTGKVVSINGKSRLLIDGKITAPVIDGPYGAFILGKTYSNVKDFGAIGVNLSKVAIRLGQGYPENTYPGCWAGKDKFNLDGAIEQIRNSLRLNPDAKIILSIGLHPYWQFTKDYPEETWIGKNGKPVYGTGIHINESLGPDKRSNRYSWPSYQSEILKAHYKEQITNIINGLKKAKLSKAIVGIHIAGGHDNQMVVTHFDYSKPAIKAFRKFLKEEYKTVEALRKAWNNPTVTFENAQPPVFSGSDDCLNPEKEKNYIDFFKFNKFAGWRMADEMGEHARKMMGKDVFTMRWCMGPYSGNPGSSLDIYDFLTKQKFDILVAQAPYNLRPPSSPTVPRVPLDSFHLHGKMYTDEFDIRTWCAAPSWEKEIMSIGWGLMIDFPMWQAANRKLAGSMFANGMGFWYLDMAPGWFNHPQILEDIKQVNEIGNQLANMKPSGWKPDTAFVIDDDQMFLRNLPSPEWMFDMTQLVAEQQNKLGSASVPYACYSLNDLINNPELAKSFKVLIFASMYYIDAPRQKLLDSLKNNNRTLIFLSGTGRLGGAEKGSGFKVAATKRTTKHQISTLPGVNYLLISSYANLKDPHPEVTPAWYDYMKKVYAIPRKGDKVLARFEFNNEAAIVERKNKNWKSVYIGEPGSLSPDYFNHLVREAGAYAVSTPGFQCVTDGNFMMLHSMVNGKRELRLPGKVNVKNVFNDREYKNTDRLTINAEAGSTYWFIFTQADK